VPIEPCVDTTKTVRTVAVRPRPRARHATSPRAGDSGPRLAETVEHESKVRRERRANR
jgi:hypothetical protein